jgi:hypothetical protein
MEMIVEVVVYEVAELVYDAWIRRRHGHNGEVKVS